MNYYKKLAVSVSEIKKQVTNNDKLEAGESLNRLWSVLATLGKNEETISCAYLHDLDTVNEALRQNRIILGSEQQPHKIILK